MLTNKKLKNLIYHIISTYMLWLNLTGGRCDGEGVMHFSNNVNGQQALSCEKNKLVFVCSLFTHHLRVCQGVIHP